MKTFASLSLSIKHATLILGAVIVLVPFYMMVSYSLKSPSEIERLKN